MCAGNELFYAMLYLLYFTSGPVVPVLGVGLWTLVCVLCCPIAIVKSGISLVHLYAASQNLVAIGECLSCSS